MIEQIMSAEELLETIGDEIAMRGDSALWAIKYRDTLLTAAKDKEIADLRIALEPLAKIADRIRDDLPDNTGLWSENSNFREPVRLLVIHAKQAKAALAQHKEGE